MGHGVDLGEGDAGFVVGNGAVAVLLIHGLTGTPAELRRVAQGLAKRGCTVFVPTLAGHCGDNADLRATRWSDWYASAQRAFAGIRALYPQVFVGGLSMGSLLSMVLAAQNPGQVAGLLLYSTTLRYDGWNMTPFVEKSPFGIKNPRLRTIIEKQMLAGESGNAGLLSMSGVSVRELHRLIAKVKQCLPGMRTPALVLHSKEDDITSTWNADYIERRSGGPVTKILLDNCYHMITVDLEYPRVIAHSADFIDGLRLPETAPLPQACAS
jgi:carboxylesterase